MPKHFVVYYPIGGRQTALNVLRLLSEGIDPEFFDLPAGFKIERLPDYVEEIEHINPIEKLFDIGGEG